MSSSMGNDRDRRRFWRHPHTETIHAARNWYLTMCGKTYDDKYWERVFVTPQLIAEGVDLDAVCRTCLSAIGSPMSISTRTVYVWTHDDVYT